MGDEGAWWDAGCVCTLHLIELIGFDSLVVFLKNQIHGYMLI